jgi:hypothetical protein
LHPNLIHPCIRLIKVSVEIRCRLPVSEKKVLYSYIGTQVIKLVISLMQFDLLVKFESEAVYPKDKLTKIAKIIKETNVSKDYDDVDAIFADMGINLDES